MRRAAGACDRCDALTCGSSGYPGQQERGVVCGQVLQGFVLQIERVPLLCRGCNLQHELLSCSGLEMEVVVAFSW